VESDFLIRVFERKSLTRVRIVELLRLDDNEIVENYKQMVAAKKVFCIRWLIPVREKLDDRLIFAPKYPYRNQLFAETCVRVDRVIKSF
jgi:hypothetical protein